jgi:hypothetical protein
VEQQYSITLPAWFLVAPSSLQVDPATGAVTLGPQASIAGIKRADQPVIPIFSKEELAKRFAADHALTAATVRIDSREQFLELLERRLPSGTITITFDPAPGFGGWDVPLVEAIRVVRGA